MSAEAAAAIDAEFALSAAANDVLWNGAASAAKALR
jgi:hypothetical protein